MGHGSRLSADSAAPIYEHAARIRRLGVFAEVREAFWKEDPPLRQALGMLTSEEVYVVPLFMAEGYFTREVVPRELGLSRPAADPTRQRVTYCPPVGTHPKMADLTLRRAISTCRLTAEARRSVALVVIGHGTERNATSGDTVYRLVADLRARNEFGAVHGGFLDEEPRIGSVLASLGSASVVLVPFLIADGWHTKTTIPQELELEGTHTTRGGMSIWYTPPVGTLPEVADVILQMTAEAGSATAAPGVADALA